MKGGEAEMELTFIETRNGKGFKIIANGQWFYTSKGELLRAINNKVGCKFRTIDEVATALNGN